LHARGLFETLRAYPQNSTSMAQQAGDGFDRFVPVPVRTKSQKDPCWTLRSALSWLKSVPLTQPPLEDPSVRHPW